MPLVITIIVIEFISGFTQGFYEPLIPSFGEALGVNASSLTLFNTIPTLVAAILVPILTKLGDIYGYRKLLRIVITVIFLATAVISVGTFDNSWDLILVGRFLNGPIAVWLPLHIALTHSKLENSKETGLTPAKAVSYILATLAVGTVFGTAISGFVHNLLGSLAATTIIPVILVFVAVLLVWLIMPEFISGAKNDIDKIGFGVLSVIMIVIMVGFVEIVGGGIDSVIGAAALLIALIIGYFWYKYEQKLTKNGRAPAINTDLIFSRKLAPLYFVAIGYGIVFYGFLSPLATYLAADNSLNGYGMGLDSAGISIAQTAILLITVVAAVIVSGFISKLGTKITIGFGMGLAIGAFLLLGSGSVNSTFPLAVFIISAGFGLGLISAAIPIVIPEIAPTGEKGLATGLFNSSQTLGGALGSGLFLALLLIGANTEVDPVQITNTGYNTVWFTCAGFLAISLLVFAVFFKEDIHKKVHL